MKFEDLLMQKNKEQQKRLDLEEEVVILRGILDEEQKLHTVLQCALHRPAVSRPCLSPLVPLQIQVLLAEVAIVEEEIICLERKVEELRLCLYEEKKRNNEWKLQQQQQQQRWQRQQRHFLCGLGSRREMRDHQQFIRTPNSSFWNQRLIRERSASLGSASEISDLNSRTWSLHDDEAERSSCSDHQNHNKCLVDEETISEKPNKLSEELMKCLITIFLKLNQAPNSLDYEQSSIVPKFTLSCMSSKSFMSKSSFNCKTPMFLSDDSASMLDPYSIPPDSNSIARDFDPYKNFIQFTRSSMSMNQASQCFPEIGKLRILMHKLCTLDLSFLTYKQKLAFWINIYNAFIMHGFLQYGLPSTPDELLALINKALLNVGGVVLNALAIEHFILRHPFDSQNGGMDVKEALLRHAYGLGYPEPNVTFALCRGCKSSPALRIYTAENVVNELERAKVEYLEASVGVTSKKKILIPKILHWYMLDFADDIESLLEWIYSQLPRSRSLKRLIMECLKGELRCSISTMVEIQPYESEFRYLLPL